MKSTYFLLLVFLLQFFTSVAFAVPASDMALPAGKGSQEVPGLNQGHAPHPGAAEMNTPEEDLSGSSAPVSTQATAAPNVSPQTQPGQETANQKLQKLTTTTHSKTHSSKVFRLSRKERKSERRQARALRKERRRKIFALIRSGLRDEEDPDVKFLLALLAIICPPLAVWLYKDRKVDKYFWWCLVMTILLWFPGVLFAWGVIYNWKFVGPGWD